jgi:hypothetical protein
MLSSVLSFFHLFHISILNKNPLFHISILNKNPLFHISILNKNPFNFKYTLTGKTTRYVALISLSKTLTLQYCRALPDIYSNGSFLFVGITWKKSTSINYIKILFLMYRVYAFDIEINYIQLLTALPNFSG